MREKGVLALASAAARESAPPSPQTDGRIMVAIPCLPHGSEPSGNAPVKSANRACLQITPNTVYFSLRFQPEGLSYSFEMS